MDLRERVTHLAMMLTIEQSERLEAVLAAIAGSTSQKHELKEAVRWLREVREAHWT
jgi:hypothetical protein